MSIEHRWTPRHPAGLPVAIESRPLGRLRGNLRNISNGGAMVHISATVPTNTPVELILPIRDSAQGRAHRLPAIVTRAGESGIGLMFEHLDVDTWAALLRQLRPSPSEDKNVRHGQIRRSIPASSRS